jgi:transposase-like protein
VAGGCPDGFALDVLVQSRRDRKAAKRLMRKPLTKNAMAPRIMITDKLGSMALLAGRWAWASNIDSTKA